MAKTEYGSLRSGAGKTRSSSTRGGGGESSPLLAPADASPTDDVPVRQDPLGKAPHMNNQNRRTIFSFHQTSPKDHIPYRYPDPEYRNDDNVNPVRDDCCCMWPQGMSRLLAGLVMWLPACFGHMSWLPAGAGSVYWIMEDINEIKGDLKVIDGKLDALEGIEGRLQGGLDAINEILNTMER